MEKAHRLSRQSVRVGGQSRRLPTAQQRKRGAKVQRICNTYLGHKIVSGNCGPYRMFNIRRRGCQVNRQSSLANRAGTLVLPIYGKIPGIKHTRERFLPGAHGQIGGRQDITAELTTCLIIRIALRLFKHGEP